MGGEKITSIVELRAGPKHNGNIYQCFAHNPTFFDDQSMQGEPNATIRLEVLCKFPSTLGSTTIFGVSGLNSKCPKVSQVNLRKEKHKLNSYQCLAQNPTCFDDQTMQGEPNA